MVGRLLLLAGAAVAQNRPWNRLGERLGFPADTQIPKSVTDAIAAARDLVSRNVAATEKSAETAAPAVGGALDSNGCTLGGGYRWCEEKKKCLREWEEPCKAAPTPVCTTGELPCTEAMQRQGMNCVVGACVKSPGSVSAMTGTPDEHGCALGGGYTWCAPKNKCLRQWEEACEVVPPTPTIECAVAGEVQCTAQLQKQGMNCVLGTCVKPVVASPPMAAMSRGGARDANGCVLGGGYTWCQPKAKCIRAWEEPCDEQIAVAPARSELRMGGARDANGCVTGGGYSWCEEKKKCLRRWEEACEAPTAVQAELIPGFVDEEAPKMVQTELIPELTSTVGGTQDLHGCAQGGGYTWCEGKQKCLRQWEEICEVPTLSVPNEEAPAQTTPKATAQLLISRVVSKLRGVDKNAIEQIEGEVLRTKFGSLKDRLRTLVDAARGLKPKPVETELVTQPVEPVEPVQGEKIGAHEDNRVSSSTKSVAVVQGVL